MTYIVSGGALNSTHSPCILHHTNCAKLTVYNSMNEWHSGLRYSCTGASMVQRQSTWPLCCCTFLTYIPAGDFTLHHRLTWWLHGQFAPHRWTVFPVSSSIHVECSASFCPFFHISVTVQKSTQDRTIRAILQNLFRRHRDWVFLFRDLEFFVFMSR